MYIMGDYTIKKNNFCKNILSKRKIFPFVILVSILIISKIDLQAQISFADSLANLKKEKRAMKIKKDYELSMKDVINVGVEFSQPSFRYGYKATAPFVGPSLILFGGLFHINYLQGIAEAQDSGKVFRQKAASFQAGFNIPLLRRQSPSFHIVPSIGFGFAFQYLDDTRRLTEDNESIDANQFGMYIRPAIKVKIGPAVATLAYNVGIAANFTPRNAVNPFTYYPTVGLYFSSLPLLMNPRDFTASGKRHYKDLVSTELVNSGLTYNKEISRNQDYITYRKTEIQYVKSTYADRYESETINLTDVRPFTYIGPRVSSTAYNGGQFENATNVGLNLGFRYGMWYVNSFIEQGDVILKSPAKAEDLRTTYNSSSFPILSGSYRNSYKYGAQVGIELISRGIKKAFSPRWDQRKEVRAATAFFGVIPYFGYGLTQLGTFSYHTPTGTTDIQEYAELTKTTVFDPSTIAAQQQFYNFGLTIHIGALGFGADYFLYPEAKQVSSFQFNLGLNVPVFRLARAILVKNYMKKIRELKE